MDAADIETCDTLGGSVDSVGDIKQYFELHGELH